MANLDGTYIYVRHENMEEYLTKIGVAAIARKLMLNTSPTVTVSHEGDNWKIEVKSTIKNHVIQFKVGEEFDDSMPDGDKFKSIATIEGETLKLKSTTAKGDLERTYSLNGDELVLHLKNSTHGVEAKRFFKKTG